jgi:hypothetical protein
MLVLIGQGITSLVDNTFRDSGLLTGGDRCVGDTRWGSQRLAGCSPLAPSCLGPCGRAATVVTMACR